MRKLYEYLRKEITEGRIDHRIRATLNYNGTIHCYIYPDNREDETIDFTLHKKES